MFVSFCDGGFVKSLKLKLNSHGFSMIELMVVVAIIGVLAAIGIPQYSKFQAKARQSEAKLSLAALFTAEQSFSQEWNLYTVDLGNAGFSVQGARLRYKTGFASTVACTAYTTTNGAPAELTTTSDTWSDGVNVNSSGATWAMSITAPTAAATSCSGTAFSATAYGNPGAAATDPLALLGDTWKINQGKALSNTQVNLGN
jgi:type IV pilus assembly protein PilA